MSLNLLNIKQYPAPAKEYHKEVYPKKQIVIHHTASGGNSKGDMDYLNTDSQGAVNVAYFIDRDGTIWQAFDDKYYSAHLGVPASTFTKFKVNNNSLGLHKSSVAIELDNWGWLSLKDGKYLTYTGAEVKPENVITYPNGFLGYKHYEKYYAPQLTSLKELLEYLGAKYNIDLTYKPEMWSVTAKALKGDNGVWTHVSYRESGKWDCHPDPKLIETLKSLTTANPKVQTKVTTSDLNLREGRGTQFKIVSTLPKGTEVNVLDVEGTWAHIFVCNSKLLGYVSTNYLK